MTVCGGDDGIHGLLFVSVYVVLHTDGHTKARRHLSVCLAGAGSTHISTRTNCSILVLSYGTQVVLKSEGSGVVGWRLIGCKG